MLEDAESETSEDEKELVASVSIILVGVDIPCSLR